MNQEKDVIKLIKEESEKLEDILNNNLLLEFAKIHNIDPKNSIFKLKQELICKKGYFFDAKKRYVLHVTDKEGVPKDDIVSTGVELKRSEFPQLTKDRMSTLFDYIVKDDKLDLEKIKTFINTTTEEMRELCKSGDKRIAKIVSYTNDMEEYKVVPSHILAMNLWNDLEYPYFVPGTKGYCFKIFGVDISRAPNRVRDKLHKMTIKNTYIAIPFEETKLPDYYSIDIDSNLDACWIKRYNSLLEPIYSTIYPNIEDKLENNIVNIEDLFFGGG